MKKLVIIGASGFIGSNLLEKLANTDVDIIAVSLNMSDFFVKLDAKNIIYEDYATFSSRTESLEDYTVINFAYTRSVVKEDIDNSIEFTYKVSNVINELKIKKYIYISTQSIYNEQRTSPAVETDKVLPKDNYGAGKVHLEEWLEEFLKNNNIKLSILRIASVVGPGMDKRITTRLVTSAINNNSINITDSGQKFSFIHIKDLIDVLIEYIYYIFNIKAEELEKNKNNIEVEIYNIGTEESYSLIDMANVIKKELEKIDKNIEINVEKVQGEYKNNLVSMNKYFSEFSWRPKLDLREIIKEEINRQLNVKR